MFFTEPLALIKVTSPGRNLSDCLGCCFVSVFEIEYFYTVKIEIESFGHALRKSFGGNQGIFTVAKC